MVKAAQRARAISFSGAFAGDTGKVFGAQLRALLRIEIPKPDGQSEVDSRRWDGWRDAYSQMMQEVRISREFLAREERK